MKLETSEDERAEWKAHGGAEGSLLRRLHRDIDTLLAEVERLRAGRASPLPAEVEEMRKRLEYAAIDIVRRQGGMDMGAEIIPLMLVEDAASLLSRWPGGWRPIETAPKDGTRVLVVWCGEIEIAWWRDDLHHPTWQEYPDGDFANAMTEITHWSPLPEPPNE